MNHSSSTETAPIVETAQTSVIEQLREQRAVFIGHLLAKQMVSPELAQSGTLDNFVIDESTKYDALMHILVGDKSGGFHHLPTVMGLDNLDYEGSAASKLNSPSISKRRLHQRQGVHENGTSHPRIVTINGQEKTDGSAMFPIEWPTEKVVKSILAVSDSMPIMHDQRRASYVHEGKVDGVKIRVVTSDKTGKIITAFPELKKK